ncbi:hypothetical protein SEA_GHOBES_19 [Gordonia phage Ghobes]|uniref:Uncharacterized protein n=1 Tax=Gordonia phage Ghobes TaxID=1887647 RepID=A0A1B3B050_9CAUD|nr:hypothetical protein KCH37_gp19 [Gordonia phage Ghobes]AOE44372.1 hypothetical protein SEA_GHOBES_19 [Gordonia phage Ghobes]
MSTATKAPAVPATAKQLAFADSLLDEFVSLREQLGQDNSAVDLPALKESLRTHNRSAVSKTIDAFLATNRKLKDEVAASQPKQAPKAPQDLPDVPAGHYAVETGEGATNSLAFYRVDRPETGKWAGWTFVKLQVSGDYQRLDRKTSAAVLRKVAEVGPEEASRRYGHELGVCGVCGRTLTNDSSREAGIGPKCAEKF